MTDFVLKKDAEWTTYESVYKYAQLLKKPLGLGMFIPCDNNGNFLEKKVLSIEEQEIKYLKKELREIKMERDILKKAVGIFSKNDSINTNF